MADAAKAGSHGEKKRPAGNLAPTAATASDQPSESFDSAVAHSRVRRRSSSLKAKKRRRDGSNASETASPSVGRRCPPPVSQPGRSTASAPSTFFGLSERASTAFLPTTVAADDDGVCSTTRGSGYQPRIVTQQRQLCARHSKTVLYVATTTATTVPMPQEVSSSVSALKRLDSVDLDPSSSTYATPPQQRSEPLGVHTMGAVDEAAPTSGSLPTFKSAVPLVPPGAAAGIGPSPSSRYEEPADATGWKSRPQLIVRCAAVLLVGLQGHTGQPRQCERCAHAHNRLKSMQELLNSFARACAVGATTIREISQRTVSVLGHRGLQHLLLALMAFSLFVLLLAVLAAVFMRVEEPLVLTRCSSPNCRRAARDLEALVDDGVSPCHDFYGHVCRRWVEGAEAASEEDSAAAVVRASSDYLDAHWRLMLAQVNSTLHVTAAAARVVGPGVAAGTGLRPVATFYRFCYRFLSASDVSLAAVLEPLVAEEAEHWKIFAAHDATSLLKTAVALSLARGVHVMFGLDFVRTAEGAAQLRVFQGNTLAQKLGEATHTPATESYLKELHGQALRRLTTVGDRDALRLEDVLEQDRRLGSLLSEGGAEVRLPVNALGSLSYSLSSFAWLLLLNSHLSLPDRLSYQDYIIVDSYDAVQDAVRFLFGGLRTLIKVAYYIYLHALVNVLRYDYQRKHLYGPTVTAGSAGSMVRTCLQLTQDVLSDTWSLLAFSVLASDRGAERAAQYVADQVTQSASEEPFLAWMGDAMSSRARKVLSAIGVRLYRPQAAALTSRPQPDETILDALFDDATSVNKFPGVYSSMRAAQRAALLLRPALENEAAADRHFLETRVHYEAALQQLLIPPVLSLRPLLYVEEVPVELSMGTFGSLLAEELYRAIVTAPTATLLWSREALLSVQSFEQCLRTLALSVLNATTADDAQLEGIGTATGELLLWTQGARLAYAGLKRALSGLRRATNWESYWLRAQKNFFRRYCLLRCSASKPTSRLRCLLPLANMAEFAEAFQCPATTAGAVLGASRTYCTLQ